MNRILLGLVAGFVTFCTVADEPAYTRIDLSNLATDKAITGKDVDGKPAQYNTGGRNRSAVFAFNGAGLSDDLKTHTSSANDTMFMSEAFDNASTKYEFPIYLQVDLGEVKTIDRVTIFNFNMANYAHRGVKDFDLYVSNADEWKTSVAEITSSYTKVLDGTLAKASGNDGQPGETFDLEDSASARFVAMVIKSQHANDNKADTSYVHYVGLSELVFYTKNGLRDQIIVDNADTSGFTAHGTWKSSSSNAHRIGADYLHNNGASSAENWVEFTPALEMNATYKVSLYWNAATKDDPTYDLSRGTNVPVVLTYDGGEMTNVVDMSVVPNGWSELGNWPFTTTGAASVKILTDGVTGRSTEKPAHVIADAVKFAVTDDPITEPKPEPEPEPTGPDAVGTDILVEAESFTTKGGWVVDPQFVEQMGSPYLLAHGKGVPCADASTAVEFPSAGLVRAWVRTRDWTPDWEGEKPGRFKLGVGGKVFPKTLGVAPATWGWVDAGVMSLSSEGVKNIYLKDLTGFEGRCDAIWFCPASVKTPPPNDPTELAAWRATMRGETEAPTDVVEADLVVVGGGIAGTAAAIAAADAGLTVAIVQDRPMLGGNASDEIRVRTEKEGHEFHWIVKAIWNTSPNGNSMAKDDTNRANVVAGYTSITPHLNWRAYGAVTDPATKKILAVDARHTETGARRRFKGAFFVDTTGDGWVGYWAGARYMLGREAKETFDEPVHGQDAADTSTMGNSLLWTTKTASEPFAFPSVPWATKVSGPRADTAGGWQWEAGLDPSEDTIDDAEMLRDRLFRAIYGSFSNTKAKAGNENLVFNFFGHIAGKRESRRLVGAYVVREKDVISHKPFEDAIGIATWSVDLHRKDGDSGFIAATTHHKYGNWWMPYRSLYSKDVPNLFMAGRCASYSHVAFGSSRVMHAGGQQGVAVGYAASLCKKYDCSPHQVYLKRAYFDELRTLINSRQSEKKMAPYVWPEPVVDKEILSVVKDNDDATGVEISGAWATSTHSDTRIGKDYLHNNKVAGEDLWVRYTPDLPVATNYTVSVYWNGDDSRSSAVPIEIVYDGGTTIVTCNMTQNPQAWSALGTWPFKAGTEGSVRILTTGQSGKTVIADAVRFTVVEKVPMGTGRGMMFVVW